MNRLLAPLVLPALLAVAPGLNAQVTLSGGPFTLIGTPTGGGGRMTQGTLAVRTAIGAPLGGTSIGGAFAVASGFDAVVVAPTGNRGVITIMGLPNGQGLLQWTEEAAGFILESTAVLGPSAVWEPVPVTPGALQFITPRVQAARFYRLREP